MVKESEIITIAAYCKSKIDLENANSSDEYYRSLPLCIIDAIFSIGAHYKSTENTVRRFCEYFGLNANSKLYPPTDDQLPVTEFINLYGRYGIKEMAGNIFQNRQRTSSRNGILKAEACLLFAEVLHQFEVDYFQDVVKVLGNKEFEAEVAEIPGQRSSISTRYFYMLAGSDDYIKPDRMITRFIIATIQRSLSVDESHEAIIGAYKILVNDYPHLTPGALDHQIWLYQSGRKKSY